MRSLVEIYEDEGRALPPIIQVDEANGPLSIEAVITVPTP